jgi:hypothetical protein
LSAKKDKTKYKEIRPPTSISIVQEKDIQYFTDELGKIITEWSSSNDKNDLINKVQSLVEGCNIYMDGSRWKSASAQNLRNNVEKIKSLIENHAPTPSETIAPPSKGGVKPSKGDVKEKLPQSKSNGSINPKRRVDLGELLQQLHNLKLALECR